jgi:hypothetical protein
LGLLRCAQGGSNLWKAGSKGDFFCGGGTAAIWGSGRRRGRKKNGVRREGKMAIENKQMQSGVGWVGAQGKKNLALNTK